jgi:hypothetical protein
MTLGEWRRGQSEEVGRMFGFGHADKKQGKVCGHEKAIPRWDRIEEAGDMQRVSQWYCSACDQFVPTVAHAAIAGQKTMP